MNKYSLRNVALSIGASVPVALATSARGISRNTSSTALRASVASALGKETVGPSEMMRIDAWKPKGYIRLGLTLIIAGMFLIISSFLLV